MTLLVLGHAFGYEMECVLRMFCKPGEKIAIQKDGDGEIPAGPDVILTRVEPLPQGCRIEAWVAEEQDTALLPSAPGDAETEWALARMLYRLLCRRTGHRPPWGILTGVRPVRLFRGMVEHQGDVQAACGTMRERYLISREKLDLTVETAGVQEALLKQAGQGDFSLYVSIPFCPSRCLYCSFVSHDIKGAAKLVPDYLALLCEEIRLTGELARRRGLRLQTVYFGGGTPTTLSPEQLEMIMGAVAESFDLSRRAEYTVEAGRPDTITPEKLDVLRRMGADRISINPQTMDDDILREIGRRHTGAETRGAFALARDAGFDNINMDLIAGLPGEDGRAFASTVDQVLALKPDSITVHTLTVKRSSRLRESGGFQDGAPGLSEMLDRGSRRIRGEGFRPYYLYRQKGTVGNLENTGYALPGKEGLYNALIMEEAQTILAVGAGGVTKVCSPHREIQRVYNYKYPHEYVSGFPEMARRKSEVEQMLKAAYGSSR